MEETDKLISQSLCGDTHAFTELVRMTQNRLRGFILWYLPIKSEVDDIAQEVYLYVFDNLNKYEAGTDFSSWLREIARYRIMNRKRSAARQAEREEKYVDKILLETEDENSQVTDVIDDRLSAMKKCLNRLPDKSRQLLEQRYFQNLNARTLSEKIDMSSSAIRMTLMRVRTILRTCIEEGTGENG